MRRRRPVGPAYSVRAEKGPGQPQIGMNCLVLGLGDNETRLSLRYTTGDGGSASVSSRGSALSMGMGAKPAWWPA